MWPFYHHAYMQFRLCNLIDRLRIGFDALPEVTVKIGETKYLVPDIAVQLSSDLHEPYPSRPVHLCIEINSPNELFSDTVAWCGEYRSWGVPYCWIIDPEDKRAWQYDSGGRPNEVIAGDRITAGPIILNHADIFETV